jgi:endonuclease/exonuclease/phosphatase family metal-dependent hydrolase
MDGRMSPRRIARIIAQLRPDIVALQEVDVGRVHSERLDQAHLIARELEMDYHFHPAWQVEEEKYGNAVLSRFPLTLVEARVLPPATTGRPREPRSAMWVRVALDGTSLHVVNTHLGLSARERSLQVAELLGPRWLGRTDFGEPCIVCGDFNMLPRSTAYRQMCQQFQDAQLALHAHRPQGTWSSSFPMGRVDHVFVSRHFQVLKVETRRSQLARTASDHLPLLVELAFES